MVSCLRFGLIDAQGQIRKAVAGHRVVSITALSIERFDCLSPDG